MKPLLSIAVPTKNRYETLKKLVELFLSLKSEDMELVIQDNSDNPAEFQEYISSLADASIVYDYRAEHLSVVENCDLSIEHSHGEYVTMIGDDDGFHRDIIKCARYMRNNGIDSMMGSQVLYQWPGSYSRVFDLSGSIAIDTYGRECKVVDLQKEIRKLLRQGAFGLNKLPRVYHGIVRRETLDKVRSITGSFFPGPSPDMANSVALAFVCEKHFWYDFPICIAGQSAKCVGGIGSKRRFIKRVEDVPFLPHDTAKKWNPRIPHCWCGPTIWAESALKSLERIGKGGLLAKFNYSAVAGRVICYFPFAAKEIFVEIPSARNVMALSAFCHLSWLRAKAFAKNFCLKHHILGIECMTGLTTIVECEEALAKNVRCSL